MNYNKSYFDEKLSLFQLLEHPKPEVSGTRIWGLLSEIYGPENAAGGEVFIVNHCPLWMFDEKGRNITPDKLTGAFFFGEFKFLSN